MGKGSNGERELRRIAWNDYTCAPLRAAGSGGSGSSIPAPDVVVCKNGRIIAVELKSNPDGTAHFDGEEIRDLEEWVSRADTNGPTVGVGAEAWVGVKPDQRRSEHSQWYFMRTQYLHETPQGNYSIRQADHGECLSIPEVFD